MNCDETHDAPSVSTTQPHKPDPSDSPVFIHVQVSVQTANNSPPREARAHPRSGVCVGSLASVSVHESLVQGGHKLPFRACSRAKCMMCLIDFALCHHLGSFFT